MMACVPCFLGLTVKNKANYKCGLPYSSYTNGTLLLSKNNLEYVFWKVGPNEPAAYSSNRAVYHDEDKFIYKIDKNAITKMTISNLGICEITGEGILQKPDWECKDWAFNDKIEKTKTFSFLICFENENANKIIESWKN